MSKFRKKPVVIEARQLSRENGPELAAWCGGVWNSLYGRGDHGEDISHISIDTLEGRMRADLGDWIIKGVKGEFYPCKPDIFAATYEAVFDDGKAQRPEGSAEGVARSEPKPQKDRDMSESDSHEIIKAAEALVDLRRDDFGDVLPWDLMSPMEREYFLAQARVVAGIVRALSLQVEGTKP
jgi:hypothetical protein